MAKNVNDIVFNESNVVTRLAGPQRLMQRVRLRNVVDAINDAFKKDRVGVTFTAQPGSKYIKIVENYNGYGGRSVYCFIDYNGNIYKSASWRAPAKHIRGSVFDENYSIGKCLEPFGAAYLR